MYHCNSYFRSFIKFTSTYIMFPADSVNPRIRLDVALKVHVGPLSYPFATMLVLVGANLKRDHGFVYTKG